MHTLCTHINWQPNILCMSLAHAHQILSGSVTCYYIPRVLSPVLILLDVVSNGNGIADVAPENGWLLCCPADNRQCMYKHIAYYFVPVINYMYTRSSWRGEALNTKYVVLWVKGTGACACICVAHVLFKYSLIWFACTCPLTVLLSKALARLFHVGLALSTCFSHSVINFIPWFWVSIQSVILFKVGRRSPSCRPSCLNWLLSSSHTYS